MYSVGRFECIGLADLNVFGWQIWMYWVGRFECIRLVDLNVFGW